MQTYIYKVIIDNIERNILSLLQHDQVFKNGLANKAIIGYVLNISIPLTKDNVYINPDFISLFHKVVNDVSPTIDSFKLSAEKQNQGFVYIIDQRDKHHPNTKPFDIIGAFEVKDGKVVVGSYTSNPNYQIVSDDGLFQLPDIYYQKMVTAMQQ